MEENILVLTTLIKHFKSETQEDAPHGSDTSRVKAGMVALERALNRCDACFKSDLEMAQKTTFVPWVSSCNGEY